MNSHKNARLTVEGRKLLIERIEVKGLTGAAEAAGVSLRTARKWLRRYQEHGLAGLADRSSRPRRTRGTVDAALEQWVEQLRRLRMPMRRIAQLVGRSVSTIGRLLARLGLSSLEALDPVRPSVRYEHVAPGEMLHGEMLQGEFDEYCLAAQLYAKDDPSAAERASAQATAVHKIARAMGVYVDTAEFEEYAALARPADGEGSG